MCLSRPAEVLEVDGCTALVRCGDRTMTVDTGPLGILSTGDHVLVHAGLAIDRVDRHEVAELEALLGELGGLMEAPPPWEPLRTELRTPLAAAPVGHGTPLLPEGTTP